MPSAASAGPAGAHGVLGGADAQGGERPGAAVRQGHGGGHPRREQQGGLARAVGTDLGHLPRTRHPCRTVRGIGRQVDDPPGERCELEVRQPGLVEVGKARAGGDPDGTVVVRGQADGLPDHETPCVMVQRPGGLLLPAPRRRETLRAKPYVMSGYPCKAAGGGAPGRAGPGADNGAIPKISAHQSVAIPARWCVIPRSQRPCRNDDKKSENAYNRAQACG